MAMSNVKSKTKPREFPMASGEMTSQEFVDFLGKFLRCSSECLQDGAICYVFMDHRHMRELLDASKNIFKMKNLCVWVKNNAGMGSFYKSQHELIFVMKHGKA